MKRDAAHLGVAAGGPERNPEAVFRPRLATTVEQDALIFPPADARSIERRLHWTADRDRRQPFALWRPLGNRLVRNDVAQELPVILPPPQPQQIAFTLAGPQREQYRQMQMRGRCGKVGRLV